MRMSLKILLLGKRRRTRRRHRSAIASSSPPPRRSPSPPPPPPPLASPPEPELPFSFPSRNLQIPSPSPSPPPSPPHAPSPPLKVPPRQHGPFRGDKPLNCPGGWSIPILGACMTDFFCINHVYRLYEEHHNRCPYCGEEVDEHWRIEDTNP